MKFLTDDDDFGIIVTPAGSPHMYQFRLVVNGRALGDREPCIIGSAVKRLGRLKKLDDSRLDPGLADPATLMRLLETDDELHDATTLSLSESLDNWLLRSYEYEGNVFLMACEYRVLEASGEVLSVTIDSSVYCSLVEMFRTYWTKCEALAG
jgi:hypothetical protein